MQAHRLALGRHSLASTPRQIVRHRAELLSPLLVRTLHLSTSRSASEPATTSAKTLQEEITWPEYLRLRKSKRRWGIFTSIPTTLTAISVGSTYIANQQFEVTQMFMGFDPLVVYGLATVLCGALGAAAGPIVGDAIFKTVNKSKIEAMNQKEAQFYRHVKRWRANPVGQRMNNPLPDWYCLKPGSLNEYRQWLRDQNIYRKKANWE